jgi:hypothetical protein
MDLTPTGKYLTYLVLASFLTGLPPRLRCRTHDKCVDGQGCARLAYHDRRCSIPYLGAGPERRQKNSRVLQCFLPAPRLGVRSIFVNVPLPDTVALCNAELTSLLLHTSTSALSSEPSKTNDFNRVNHQAKQTDLAVFSKAKPFDPSIGWDRNFVQANYGH